MGLFGSSDSGGTEGPVCALCSKPVVLDVNSGKSCPVCDTPFHKDCLEKGGYVREESSLLGSSSVYVTCPNCNNETEA